MKFFLRKIYSVDSLQKLAEVVKSYRCLTQELASSNEETIKFALPIEGNGKPVEREYPTVFSLTGRKVDIIREDDICTAYTIPIPIGRYVYYTPWRDTGTYDGLVPVLDTVDNTVRYIDLAEGNPDAKGYQGGVYDGERYIYFAPYKNENGYHGLTAILDTTDNSVSYVDLNATVNNDDDAV